MQNLRAEKQLPIRQKHRSTSWKWATAFYVTAWPFAVTQAVIFGAIVGNDQLCQTGITHGFNVWRTVFAILSVFAAPIALLVELIFNDLQILIRHIVLPLLGLVVYLGLSASLSVMMGEPIYGLHINYRSFVNKIDWTAELAKYADQPNIVPRVEYCRQHFLD